MHHVLLVASPRAGRRLSTSFVPLSIDSEGGGVDVYMSAYLMNNMSSRCMTVSRAVSKLHLVLMSWLKECSMK
jgi:hypothetical protein